MLFQATRENVTQMVSWIVLSHISLEFRNQLFFVLSYRKEIPTSCNTNIEKLYKFKSVVL